jgi:hypothetical protein
MDAQETVDEFFEDSGQEGPFRDFVSACTLALLETPIAKRQTDNLPVLFEETRNGVHYRGFVRASYYVHRTKLGDSRPKEGFKTMYITHIAISPTGGKIVSDGLFSLLRLPELTSFLDAIYIEAILDDEKVLPHFLKEGWIQYGDSSDVFALRNNKAVSKRYRQKVAIPRYLEKRTRRNL